MTGMLIQADGEGVAASSVLPDDSGFMVCHFPNGHRWVTHVPILEFNLASGPEGVLARGAPRLVTKKPAGKPGGNPAATVGPRGKPKSSPKHLAHSRAYHAELKKQLKAGAEAVRAKELARAAAAAAVAQM
jgi:hypothetical protein